MKRRGQRKRDTTDTTRRDMGGDNFKESMIKNEDVDEDEECQCGNGAGCCPKSGWIACCCCCKIRTRYIPDLVCLVFLLAAAAVQIHVPFSIMGIPLGFIFVVVVRNFLAGFFFTLILFVYFPLVVCSTTYFWCRKGKPKHGNCCSRVWSATSEHIVGQPPSCCLFSRFRVIFNLLVLVAFLSFLIFPILVLLPEARTLSEKIENEFGAYQLPERASPTAVSFGDWAFASLNRWGEYGSLAAPERFPVKTFTYKTGITQHAGYRCTMSRDWKPYLELDVHFPSSHADSPIPIIFHIHGGGFSIGDKGAAQWSFAYFLDRGFAIVSVQYSLACYGYSALDMRDDLATAFEYVRANAKGWGLDRDRIHMVGESAGAHLALLTAYTLNSSSVRSVSNLYGITDMGRFHEDLALKCADSTGERDGYFFTLLGRSCAAKAFAAASPVTRATVHAPPTLTMHGTWDMANPFEHATLLHKRLDALGVPNLLVPLSTFDHGFDMGYNGGPAQMHRFAFERLLAATNT